jgi:hypothetical protein
MYTGVGGDMMSHPFAVDRVKYLQEWADSPEYDRIRRGEYKRVSVEVPAASGEESETDRLQRQIEELQSEINRWRDRDQ